MKKVQGKNKIFIQVGFAHIEILFVILAVAVLGITVFFASKNYNSQTPQSTPISEVIMEDDVSDWEIYVNNRHGYQIKYPNDYLLGYADTIAGEFKSITGVEDQIDLLPTKEDEYKNFMQLSVINAADESLENLVKENYNSQKQHFRTTKISDLLESTFSGTNSYEYTFSGEAMYTFTWSGVVEEGEYKVVYFEKDGKFFSAYLNNSDVFNQILSTFEFIEPTVYLPDGSLNSEALKDANNWKTYENKEIGIEFKYPILKLSNNAAALEQPEDFPGVGIGEAALAVFKVPNTNAKTWYSEKQIEARESDGRISVLENTLVNDLEAYTFTISYDAGDDMYYLIEENSDLYEIHTTMNVEVRDIILDTFKFTQ